MTAVCGLATSFVWLLLARIGVGVGEAGASPPSHSLISDYFPFEKRATALSIYALGIPFGSMIGNFVGGWGAEELGWRTTFVLVGLPGIAIALLILCTLREPPRGLSDRSKVAVAHPRCGTDAGRRREGTGREGGAGQTLGSARLPSPRDRRRSARIRGLRCRHLERTVSHPHARNSHYRSRCLARSDLRASVPSVPFSVDFCPTSCLIAPATIAGTCGYPGFRPC